MTVLRGPVVRLILAGLLAGMGLLIPGLGERSYTLPLSLRVGYPVAYAEDPLKEENLDGKDKRLPG